MFAHSAQRGVTLMELMVAIGIVSVLAAVAVPPYQQSIKRAAREGAKTDLMANAQFLERNFTEANRYDVDSAGKAISLPVTQSPRSSAAKYTIGAAALGAASYTLAAAPVKGGLMDGDECGSFTLTHLGQQGLSGAKASASVASCWGR